MKKPLLLVLFFIIIFNSEAQQELYQGSARLGALAGIRSPIKGAEAIWANPAGLNSVSSLSAQAYVDNRFGVSGLGSQSIGLALPFAQGGLGVSFGSFGFDAYQQSRFGAAIGMAIAENASLGLNLAWYRTSISDIQFNRLSADFGGIIGLGESLDLGFVVSNPFDLFESADAEIELPAQVRLGLAYRLADGLSLYTELDKVVDRKENIKFGLEYWFFEKVCTRWGYGVNPGLFTFGLGVNLGNFRLDFTGSSHQYLGFSPQFSAIWNLAKDQKS